MKKQINETLLELIVGILLSGAVIEAGCIVVTGYSRAFTSGLCIGLVLAIGLAAHMYRSIDHALDLLPEDAEKYMRKAYMIRAAAILIVAGGVTYFKLGYVMATFGGVLCLKFGAFLQPVIHRVIHGKEPQNPQTEENTEAEKTETDNTENMETDKEKE